LLPTSTSTTHHTFLAKEYPHFSPGALFIRSAYVLHIHKDKFHHSPMCSWENGSAKFMSSFLNYSEYFNKSTDNDDMDHCSPYFPYIYHLPCKQLDEIWNLSSQISKPVPFHHIFEQISMCIYGKATTFHTSFPLHSRYNEHAEDQISSLQSILMEASSAIDREMLLVRNCEKQKRHQHKKKESQFDNIYIPKDQDKSSTHTGLALSYSLSNIFCGLIIPREQKHLHVNLDLSLVLVNGAVMDRCGYSQNVLRLLGTQGVILF